MGDASVDLAGEHTQFSAEIPQALKYNCGNPAYDPLLCGDEGNSLLEMPGDATSDVAYVQEGCKIDSIQSEVLLQRICSINPKIEGPECDWNSLIPDATDLLIFNSPNEAEVLKGLMQKPLDYSVRLSNFMSLVPQSTINNALRVDSVASGSEHEIEDYHPELIAATDTDHRQDNTNVALMTGNTKEKLDNEVRK